MNRMIPNRLYSGVGRKGRHTSVIVGFTYAVEVYDTVAWVSVVVDTSVLVAVC
jgi:hypothetical protein